MEWVLIAMIYGYGHWYPITSEHFRTSESCIQFGENIRKQWKTTQFICVERKL